MRQTLLINRSPERNKGFQALRADLLADLNEIYSLATREFELDVAAFGIVTTYLEKEYELTYLQASGLVHKFPEFLQASKRILQQEREHERREPDNG